MDYLPQGGSVLKAESRETAGGEQEVKHGPSLVFCAAK